MKLGPATKLYRRNKATSKKVDDHVMSANCDAMVYKSFITFYFTKLESRTKKSLTQLTNYCFG